MNHARLAALVAMTSVLGCQADQALNDALPEPEVSGTEVVSEDTKQDDSVPAGTLVLTDSDAAFEHDVRVVAEQRGLPLDETRSSLTFQRDFALYAEELLTRYPGQLAGIWVDPVPSQSGHIVFVGAVPTAEPSTRTGVALVGGASLSIDEQYQRVRKISEAMVELGYQDHEVYFEQQSQRVILKSRPDSSGQMVDLNAVATNASARLKDMASSSGRTVDRNAVATDASARLKDAASLGSASAALTVTAAEIDLTEKTETLQPGTSRGGNWLRHGVNRQCTSGFSVMNTIFVLGVTTATHCVQSNLDVLEQTDRTTQQISFKSSHGSYAHGDVAWYQAANANTGSFFSAPNTITGQNSYRHTNAMAGQTVCHYGRSSNFQNCNYVVQTGGLGCFWSDAPINANVCDAFMAFNVGGTTATWGDSGGPVFMGTTVYGGFSSFQALGIIFTPVEVFQSQLGILVTHP
jgi:hypothetical protein